MDEPLAKRRRLACNDADCNSDVEIMEYADSTGTLVVLPWECIVMIIGMVGALDLPWMRAASKAMRHAVDDVCKQRDSSGADLRKMWRGAVLGSGRANEGMQWYSTRIRFMWTENPCNAAAEVGNLKMLRWMIDNRCPISKRTPMHAARGGHLHIVTWFYKYHGPHLPDSVHWDTELICAVAAEYGHIRILDWVYHRIFRRRRIPESALGRAARGNQRETMQWLLDHGCKLSGDAFSDAVRGGHLQMLEWMHEMGCRIDSWCIVVAIETRRMDVLRWLLDHGCRYDQLMCQHAIQNDNLDALICARSIECPWDEQDFAYAALKGNMDVIRYMHESGCPWDDRACRTAAGSGHLPVLQYLHENGCPWTRSICTRKPLDEGMPDDWHNCQVYIHSGSIDTWPCAGDPCDWATSNRMHRVDHGRYMLKTASPRL